MKTKQFLMCLVLLLAGLAALMLPPSAYTQEKQSGTSATQADTAAEKDAGSEAKPPAIDPEAVAVVQKMEKFIKTLTAYSIHSETETDEVLLAGPKVQFGGTIDGTLQLPNRLHMLVTHDDKDTQEFFYDGSTLSVWLKDRNVWASAPAAPTVGEMITTVRAKYGLSFPLHDVLRSATQAELLKGVTAGVVIGTGFVAGVECDHLGFHKEGIDAQIWIEKGDRPLPRKFVITTLEEPSQPQHSEILTWDLSPKLEEAMFTFTPPAGAEKIVFAEPTPQKTTK